MKKTVSKSQYVYNNKRPFFKSNSTLLICNNINTICTSFYVPYDDSHCRAIIFWNLLSVYGNQMKANAINDYTTSNI